MLQLMSLIFNIGVIRPDFKECDILSDDLQTFIAFSILEQNLENRAHLLKNV